MCLDGNTNDSILAVQLWPDDVAMTKYAAEAHSKPIDDCDKWNWDDDVHDMHYSNRIH